jgi:two-component system, chemotaxis family, sensor kinase CheA
MVFSHFDFMLDVVIVFNERREISYFNSATATLLDMSPRRIDKANFLYELIILKNKNFFLTEDGTAGKDEELKLTEVEFITKKGKIGTGLISIRKMEIETDSEQLWLTVIRDISLEVSLHNKYQEKLREMKVANRKLEEYSRDLENMVEKRTLELKIAHDFQLAMVNSLDQGLLVFDIENNCHPSFTIACLDLFPESPDGVKVYDVLGYDEKEIDDFKKWSSCIFSNILPFDDASRLGPQCVELATNDEYKYVSLEYYPMYDDQQNIHSIVMVGTNKTEEVKAKKLLEEKDSYVNMVTKILSNKKQFLVFYRDFMACMNYLKKINFEKKAGFDKEKIQITLHSMKGSCSVYGMTILGNAIHQAEDSFNQYLENFSDETIDQFELRIDDIEKVSQFNFEEAKKFVGGSSLETEDERSEIKLSELIKFRNKLVEYGADKIANYFSNEFLKTPIGDYFSGYNDLVHELADELNKEVAPLTFKNQEIKVNTEGYDEFFNALPHLFRNCVYHGIENPLDREEKSKESSGHIDVKFDVFVEKNKTSLKIVVSDDGAGIDTERIREKLIEIGNPEALSMTEQDLVYQIFTANISTVNGKDNVAGRGVGMHAVKVAVENLKGKVDVKTVKDEGTEFTFVLPLVG